MRLPKFEHKRPASIEEASELREEYGSGARFVAGGTDLYPRLKYGMASPDLLISLKGIPVNPPRIEQEGDLCLDALMTLADVVRSQAVQERAPILVDAALRVGSNQIRHMGTLGGNLCLETRCAYYNQSHTFQYVEPCFKRKGDFCYLIHKAKKCRAVFMADTAPALLCLDAKVEIKTSRNSRQVPLEALYTGDSLRPLALSDGEILSGAIIPSCTSLRGTAFTKFSLRGGLEFAALNVGVRLDMADDGTSCASARIVVGAVSGKPLRAIQAEAALAGQTFSDDLFQEAARKAAAEIHPVMHHGYSAPFLKECVKVQAFRTLALASKKVSLR